MRTMVQSCCAVNSYCSAPVFYFQNYLRVILIVQLNENIDNTKKA